MGLFKGVRCITMSYKWETDKEHRYYLQGTMADKRRKLTDKQREEIKNDSTHSYRELARLYGTEKTTIMFIKRPEARLQNLERRRERGGSKRYYDKEKHRDNMRRYREHKKQIYLLGELGCLSGPFVKENKDGQ